ncbi:CoA pyrophosphatase [Palleronia sediminis]|uniref:CoA pyrophosphatase n=1 Tax=Palleronia sediminis TaxID=2547833 RepID=A0A4R6A642_9RHOB|nr:CoA pyrophosphatase [Palleronia sediminis]TDL78157.1 CoA pyrophosphatase [Palleronia sediminis]
MTADLRDRLLGAIAAPGTGTSDSDLNDDRRPAGGVLRQAGVLAAFDAETGALWLTKRASHLSQHPGQIAFPGGRMDAGDADITATALREAHEEIALPPDALEVLGTLPAHVTVTGYVMTPVIALVTAPFRPVPEPGEVAEVFRVPFARVADPAGFDIQARQWRGVERRYYTVPVGPHYVWGATARVLRGLAERLAR